MVYLDTNDSDKLSFSLNNNIFKSIESGEIFNTKSNESYFSIQIVILIKYMLGII